MQMRTGTYAGVSAESNLVALFHLLPHSYQHLTAMSVTGLFAILMIDVDYLTVAASPSCLCNSTAAGSVDRSTGRNCPVHSLVVGAGSGLGCFTLAKL